MPPRPQPSGDVRVIGAEPTEAPPTEQPEPVAGRLARLRARLGPLESALGRGLLGAALPRRARRADLGGGRGHPARRRPRRRPDPELVERLRERVKVEGPATTATVRGHAARGAARPGRHRIDRTLHTDAARRPAGGRPRRRRQRHRQDHHRRQAGPGAGRRGPDRGARRGRHVPRRGRRPAADLGRPGRVRTVVRGPEGGDPASVAFDAVQAGHRRRVDVGPHRHRRPAAEQGRADGRARQGQAGRREARPGRRGAARARRHDRPERPASRPGSSPRSSTSPASC